MRTFLKASVGCAISLAFVLSGGCTTNNQADDAVPVYLQVNFQTLPLQKNVADSTPLQISTVVLTSVIKNPSAGSSAFLDTKMDDYVVTWKRLDGGTKVSPSEVFGGNQIVPGGGTTTLSNYQFLSVSALSSSPLDQLFPYNGGIDRETGKSEIRQQAIVTFRGRTYSGQPVQGEGNFDMTFRYLASQGRVVPQISESREKGAWVVKTPGSLFAF